MFSGKRLHKNPEPKWVNIDESQEGSVEGSHLKLSPKCERATVK
jgi:hypothetical protein